MFGLAMCFRSAAEFAGTVPAREEAPPAQRWFSGLDSGPSHQPQCRPVLPSCARFHRKSLID